jgi:hypothetical protein
MEGPRVKRGPRAREDNVLRVPRPIGPQGARQIDSVPETKIPAGAGATLCFASQLYNRGFSSTKAAPRFRPRAPHVSTRWSCPLTIRDADHPAVDDEDCAGPQHDHQRADHYLADAVAFDHAFDCPGDANDDGNQPPVLAQKVQQSGQAYSPITGVRSHPVAGTIAEPPHPGWGVDPPLRELVRAPPSFAPSLRSSPRSRAFGVAKRDQVSRWRLFGHPRRDRANAPRLEKAASSSLQVTAFRPREEQ